MQQQITISTKEREEIIDITEDVEAVVSDSKVENGLCSVFVPHATAAITANENADPNVCDDILTLLRKVVPHGVWKHDRIDGNADAHIKAGIVGPSETIPIHQGKLVLGTWQNIFLCDFDGPRERKVIVTIIQGKEK